MKFLFSYTIILTVLSCVNKNNQDDFINALDEKTIIDTALLDHNYHSVGDSLHFRFEDGVCIVDPFSKKGILVPDSIAIHLDSKGQKYLAGYESVDSLKFESIHDLNAISSIYSLSDDYNYWLSNGVLCFYFDDELFYHEYGAVICSSPSWIFTSQEVEIELFPHYFVTGENLIIMTQVLGITCSDMNLNFLNSTNIEVELKNDVIEDRKYKGMLQYKRSQDGSEGDFKSDNFIFIEN